MKRPKTSVPLPGKWLKLLLATACLSGFTAVQALGQLISFPAREITTQQAIEQIESQAGLIVGVNHHNFDTSRSISLPSLTVETEDLLDQMVASTGHTYIRQGKHIVIVTDVRPMQETEAVKLPADGNVDLADLADLAVHLQSPVAQQPASAPVTVTRTDIYKKVDGELVIRATDPQTFRRLEERQPSFALKTNLLYGAATLTPNLGVEFGIGRRTTLEIAGGWNPWNREGSQSDNKKLVHRYIRPEFRWWTCERFNGHFFGIHAIGANFNISQRDIPFIDFDKEYRYQGNAFGGGLTYGYNLMISPVMSLEFSVGAGVLRLDYDRYGCDKCDREKESFTKTRFAPTKAGISLVFIIK